MTNNNSKNISFEIRPTIGIGEIEFGIPISQAIVFLGPADSTKISKESGETRECRRDNGLQLVFSKDEKKLVEIGISDNITELNYENIFVFLEDPISVIKEISKADNQPYELYGFLVFPDLGISLTGFHEEDDTKAVVIFKKGRFDFILPEMRKYKFTL